MFVGYVSATEAGTYAANQEEHNFFLELPARGVTDLALPREKKFDTRHAYFDLTNVDNPTGYRCYLNVRDKSGSNIVGEDPVELFDNDIGFQSVKYLSWAGVLHDEYRPSGQTYSGSAKSAFIEGSWTP